MTPGSQHVASSLWRALAVRDARIPRPCRLHPSPRPPRMPLSHCQNHRSPCQQDFAVLAVRLLEVPAPVEYLQGRARWGKRPAPERSQMTCSTIFRQFSDPQTSSCCLKREFLRILSCNQPVKGIEVGDSWELGSATEILGERFFPPFGPRRARSGTHRGPAGSQSLDVFLRGRQRCTQPGLCPKPSAPWSQDPSTLNPKLGPKPLSKRSLRDCLQVLSLCLERASDLYLFFMATWLRMR